MEKDKSDAPWFPPEVMSFNIELCSYYRAHGDIGQRSCSSPAMKATHKSRIQEPKGLLPYRDAGIVQERDDGANDGA